MPFEDELEPVKLVTNVGQWINEFEVIRSSLKALELSDYGAIEHVGSTSVPGLVAKDVIDIQIRLPALDDEFVSRSFLLRGYRQRPEAWNKMENTRGGLHPKMVFATAPGLRRMNIHVRPFLSPGAHDSLLFRDYLRASPLVRAIWDRVKRSIVASNPEIDINEYGRAKQQPWQRLMSDADDWARSTEWSMADLRVWTEI